MKAEIVNSFIRASLDVIEQTTGLKAQLGQAYRQDTPYSSDSLVVLIGLTGDLQGSVAISLSQKTACKIASLMMGGMPVPTLDEMGKSAIAELCNMILGNAGILLSQLGTKINVTPPATLTGENIMLSMQNVVIICIPLLFENSKLLELNISYRESNQRH
ncbi:MAG TPA: chemotaxis protein CheX [Firmicutes bacterium]|jgi:chemotaxis protein CheX|nr:chemotaxis protein CheX [Bacillota bacterium]